MKIQREENTEELQLLWIDHAQFLEQNLKNKNGTVEKSEI